MKLLTRFIIPVIICGFTILGIEYGLYYKNFNPFKHIKQSGAMKAMHSWQRERAYPEDDIPEAAYYRAYEQMQAEFSKQSMILNNQWQDIGPKNIGGRTISIAIDPVNPNIIYAGAASGGLWRSTTGGAGVQAWEYIETGYPVNGVGAIAINYDNPDIIYIGTGEVYAYQNSIGGLSIRATRGSYGIGILKTTDGGDTWTKSLDWSYNQKRGVQMIRIHPVNPEILFAATTEGIYKSTNAGGAWTLVHPVIMATDLLIHPNSPDTIISAHGNLNSAGNGIYRSTNGGATWLKITSGLPASYGGKTLLAGFESDPDIVWASIGFGETSGAGTNLAKSTDFGATWTVVNTDDYATYQGWFSHFVVPHPTDPSKILTAGVDVFKSTDGGTNFSQKSYWYLWDFGVPPVGGPEGPPDYSHADHHAYAIHPTNPNIVYFGNDGGVFRTTDFGETFSGLNGGYQSTQFYKRFGVSKADTTRAIGGMQDNATAIWEGTVAWRRVLGGDGCCTQISHTNTDTMYGSSQYLSIRRSTNKGLNWSGIAPPSSNPAFNGQFLVAPSNSKILYGGGEYFYKTTNAGNNWTALNSGAPVNGDPVLSIAISYTNPDTVYITTAPYVRRAEVFRSTNGGTTFTNITSTLPDRYPVDISVDPADSRIVYITFSGYGTPHLYKSTDAGASWTDISGNLPDVPTSAVIIDPENRDHLFVGNDLGVFVSFNGGANWNLLNNGIPGSFLVMDLAYSPVDRMLFAATHGRGVYRIPLTGLTSAGTAGSENTVTDFALGQNYPNPFNAGTQFSFTIPQEGDAAVRFYDVTGKQIAELLSGTISAGTHSVRLGASQLNDLASGVYYYSVEWKGRKQTKKLIYMK